MSDFMNDVYDSLIKDLPELKNAGEEISGLDDFMSGNTVKVASLGDLSDFFRISTDTLVHKAEKDLWRIGENSKGEVVIERLFDPANNKPIKV